MHGKDFRIVNERVWSALAGWYGGGPPLQRSVIQVGKSHLELEVYPIVLRVNRIDRHGHPLRVRVASGAAEPGVEILMSRIASFVDMRRAACKMLKMDPRAVRVWDCSNGERGPQRLVEGQDGASAAKLTLEDLNFADGQLLLFEEPLRSFDLNRHHGSLNSGTRNGGGWPRGTYAEGQVYTPDSAMDLQQRRQQQHHQRASSSPSSLAPISGNAIENTWKHSVHGVTGLQNLGNTCYMNSSLQCLGNVRPLVEYFRSNAYIADLNNDSVMGSKMAELADTYGALVMDGWGARGSRGAVAPRYFKKVLGRFRENFAGYTQEDAQEFLAAMFDGLGEDLNRVVDKPYVEQPDSDGRPDLEVAKEWWTNQQKRENSIVQALFTGQFKSRWRCQCCGFESARFEPYTFLQLPLPDPIECSVSVTLHYFENSRVPLRCTLRVPINGTAADILEAVCDAQLGTGADDARCAHLLPFKPENLLLIHRHGPKNLVIGRNMSTRRLSDSQIMVHCYQLAAKSRAQGEVAHDEASGGEKDDGDNDRNANDPEEGDDGHRATARQSSLRDEHDVEIDRVVPHTRVLAYFEGQLHSPYPGRVVSESATKPGAYAIAFDDGDFDGQVARSHINTRVSLDVKPIILTALHREFEIVTPYFWNRLRPKLFGEAVILRIIPGDTTGYELYKTVWKHTRYLFPHMKGPVVEGSTMDIDIWRSVPSLEDRAAMVAEYKTRGSEDSENDDGGGIGRTSRHGQSPCLMLGDGSPVLSWGFCLRRVNESGTMCPTTPWTRGCLGTELADGGDGIHILEGSHVAIDWEPSVRQQMHDLGKCLEIHKSVERCRRADKKALSLYECVDKFVSPEKLDGNDQVYCSSCKSHQDGTKCVNMFRNPPVLVVHLKRFKFNQYVRGKISRLVTFPVENADLRFAMPPPPRKQVPVDLTYWRFLGGKMQSGCDASAGRVTQGFELAGSVGDSVSAGESREANAGEAAATKTGDELPPPLYDCIGVVNHAGSLGAGHYTAFCKNPYDGKWRHFNDSLVTVIEDKNRIVTNKAYLLFYMRQDLCGESMAPGFDYRMATPKELEKRLALRKKLKGSGGRCAIS